MIEWPMRLTGSIANVEELLQLLAKVAIVAGGLASPCRPYLNGVAHAYEAHVGIYARLGSSFHTLSG